MDPTRLATIDPGAIPDPGARQAIQGLLGLVGQLVAENRALREENQRPRDEVNRLKGKRGQPPLGLGCSRRISGSMTVHSSSLTSSDFMPTTPASRGPRFS